MLIRKVVRGVFDSPQIHRCLAFSVAGHSIKQGSNQPTSYPIKNTRIRTCDRLYRRLRKDDKDFHYRLAPVNGIVCNVEYADTQEWLPELSDGRSPVILAIHGLTGSHKDFSQMITNIGKEGVRVIAPNFPSHIMGLKTLGIFRNSTEERVEYLKDFLTAINVHRIDAVIAHSGGNIPALKLWLDPDGPRISSLGFFSPMGHRFMRRNLFRLTPRILKSYWLDGPGYKMLLRLGGKRLLRLWGSRAQIDDLHQAIGLMSAYYYSGYQKLGPLIEELKEAEIPVLYVFGEKDTMVEKEIFYEQVKMMGIDQDEVEVYDESGRPLTPPPLVNTNRIRVMAFQGGGHYTHAKYFGAIKTSIFDLIQKSHQPQLPIK